MNPARSCFVIMPIATPVSAVTSYRGDEDHFQHVLEHLVRPALESEGYQVIPPLIDNSEIIQGEIIRHLATSDLVLCDVTGWNANVFFELGIRVALDLPVALIRDDQTTLIPFDNSMISCHTYSANIALWNIQQELDRLGKHIRSAGSQKRNAMWKYFGIAQTASLQNSANPIEAKLDIVLSELAKSAQQAAPSPPTGRTPPPSAEPPSTAPRSAGGLREYKFLRTPVEQQERENAIAAEYRAELRRKKFNIAGLAISEITQDPPAYHLAINASKLSVAQYEELKKWSERILRTDNNIHQVDLQS